MNPEISPKERFESVSVITDNSYGGTIHRLTAKMPTAEYYPEEISRLSSVALLNSCEIYLGYDDHFQTRILFREIKFDVGSSHIQVRDIRDTVGTDDEPLLIQMFTILPSTESIDSDPIVPLEVKIYTPADDKLQIARLDDLSLSELKSPRLEKTISFELKMNPVKPTRQDRFVFYAFLLAAAGEAFQL
jgi:hypothetical protein